MSTTGSSVERVSTMKPVRRPRGPQVLTFIFTFLHPVIFGLIGSLKESPMKAATRKHPYLPSSNPNPLPQQCIPTDALENCFVDALVKACSCRHYPGTSPPRSRTTRLSNIYPKVRRRSCHNGGLQSRSFHRAAHPARSSTARAPLSREEYLNMVDYYRESFSTQATSMALDDIPPAASLTNPPEPRNSTAQSLSPTLHGARDFSHSRQDHSRPQDHPMVTRLVSILQGSECTHDDAFEAYSALPSPGIAYLSNDMRRLLFRRLSTLEKKSRDSGFRYLSVIEDMKELNLPLTEAEWNSAIAFCGQNFAHISAAEVETALLTWKEMEQEACVNSGNVTFNILFDMAAKAGKFVLAEMILKEMENRNLTMNRYSRTGIIYYYGLKGDGDGIRRAYRDFVEAGEIVDTVVMNCVIAALIQAGELPAAENVYERMKRVLAEHTGREIPSLNWKETRNLGRLLDRRAHQFRNDPILLQKVREEQFLAPNLHTYAIFVDHHASNTGELRRIMALLTEMQLLGVSMHGRIFLKLFKGFANHGGVRYTSWTSSRLESVWTSFVQVIDKGVTDVAVQKWMIIWTVRAFQRCCGRDRTLEIWEELRRRWRPGNGELEFIHKLLWEVLKSEHIDV